MDGASPLAAARIAGGLNVYAARDWRFYVEYRFDLRFAAINPGPLEDDGWRRQSLVLGFAVSPDGYQEALPGSRTMAAVLPFLAPLFAWTGAAVVKGLEE